MPVIPSSRGSQAINQHVTGFPKQDARAQSLFARSLEGLGKVGTDLASQLYQKQVSAEDATYRANAKSDMTRYSMELQQRLDKEFADNPRGYSQAFEKEIEKKRQSLIKEAPYERTRKSLELESSQLRDRFVLSAFDAENQRIAARDREQDFEQLNLDSQTLVNKPNPEALSEFFINGTERIKSKEGVSYTPDQANKAIQSMSTGLAKSYLSGLALEENYEEGLAFIEGQDEHREMLKNVDAGVLASYKGKFQRGLRNKNQRTLAEGNIKAADMQAALLSGREVDPGRLQTMKDFAVASGNKEMADTLDIAEKVNKKLIEMDDMTLEEMQVEAAKGIDFDEAPEDFNFNKRQRIEKHAAEAFQAKIRERKSGADFYVNNNKNLSTLADLAKNDYRAFEEYIPAVIAAQSQDKSQPHLLSRDMKNHFAQAISNKEHPGEAAMTAINLRESLREQFAENGDNYYAQMIGELAIDYSGKDPTVDLSYSIAARMNNDRTIEDAFNAIGKRKENEEYLNKLSGFDKKREIDDVNHMSAKISRDYFAAGDSPTRRKYATALASLAEDMYIHNRAKGMSKGKALDAAQDQVYNQNFTFLSSGESNLILPKNLEPHKGKISSNLRELAKDIDTSIIRPLPLYENMGKEGESLMRQEIEANGVWITNSSMSGAQLALFDGDTASYTAVRSKEGDTIEIPYSQLVEMPDIKEEKRKEELSILKLKGRR